jgi:hypothetical protein
MREILEHKNVFLNLFVLYKQSWALPIKVVISYNRSLSDLYIFLSVQRTQKTIAFSNRTVFGTRPVIYKTIGPSAMRGPITVLIDYQTSPKRINKY